MPTRILIAKPGLDGHDRGAKVIAQALRDAGVQAIFGPGTNLVKAAEEVLRLLGHNMPPEDAAA